jgi:predicted naringenin-chalcone synthase
MSLSISGLGTALPCFSVTQEQSLAYSLPLCCFDENQAELMQLIFMHSGVKRRYSMMITGEPGNGVVPQIFYPTEACGRGPTTGERMAEYARHAPTLAVAAAKNAMADAGTQAADITHVVSVSCTGFMAPGIDMTLIDGLGLRPTVERTHIGFMGCHGAFNGLKVARGNLSLEPEARVLVCAVEMCTLHYFTQWDPEKIVANALFSDGAGAVVCQNDLPGAWRLAAAGTVRIPDSATAMTWNIGDHGFDMGLSRRIPELIFLHLRGWLEAWLDRQGLALKDIGSWAVHPGGPKILEAVENALSLPAEALDFSRGVLADCGNMSSPTVLFILERMRRANAPRPCVGLGFGPGMVVEAALFL